MSYLENIESLISQINTELVNFSEDRKRWTPPTQVSSEFLTNKEQWDWAEKTLLDWINNNASSYVAVKYGRSDNIIAWEEWFKEFYEQYQDELDTIGKRPDLLIFKKEDFQFDTNDISNWSQEDLDVIVPKAKCWIEVRSSAFLIWKYEAYMENKINAAINEIMRIKNIILENYSDLLKWKNEELYKIVEMLNQNNVHIISFKAPSWKASTELSELSDYLKQIKENIKSISSRTFLSITPKVEDLKVVYNWINKYQVPHYYVQVFFDKAYGISFEKILSLISDPEKEDKEYFIESDIKNQNKTTIKIHANKEANVLTRIDLPEHYSAIKELWRWRLLFYVKFRNSVSIINKEDFKKLFWFNLI